MAGGRPTDYKPEYCDQLVDHMANGYSFESFAGIVDTCKQTLYNWLINPEFLDAKKRATEKCRFWWEKAGIESMGSAKLGNATIWIMNMKNRFSDEWKDKHEYGGDPANPIAHKHVVEFRDYGGNNQGDTSGVQSAIQAGIRN